MTIKSLLCAMEVDGLRPAEKLTLMFLADMEDPETGACFATPGDLAGRVGVSASSIRKHLKTLEDAGHIVRFERFYEDGGQMPSAFLMRLHSDGGYNTDGRD